MSPLRLLSRILIVALAFTLAPALSHAQGIPWYTIPLPVPNGFVDAATGNVHLEIPLGSMPQRNGDPIVSRVVYDTTTYTYLFGLWNENGSGWQTIVGSSHSILNVGVPGSGQTCTSFGLNNYPNGVVNTWSGFWFKDIHNTLHSTPSGRPYETIQVNCSDNYGHSFGNSMDVTSLTLADQDELGYTFQISNYNQITSVYAADGTLVLSGTNNDGLPVDTNGNMGSLQGSQPNLYSGLPGGVVCGSSTVTTSSGSSATYTGTCTNQNVSNVINGTTYVGTESLLTSLALPDGTSYSFTYDTGTTGNLMGVTLPTGGTISFTYTGFLKAASAAFAGGTWNLTYGSVGSQNTTTVLGPLRYDSATRTNVNDMAVFTGLPNGSLLLQTAQYYSGSSTLLKTVSYAYDGGLRPATITTTLNDTGQSSQISLQYLNGLRNFVSQKQETDFTGTTVRTTKTTYTSGTFIKPASINVYSGSGTGSPISSTLFTCDEYSANYCKNNVPMLASFTGAYGHDDTNFGIAFTARGNLTTIQRLSLGTTYSTTHMCYDTLGNVTQTVDANGNPTSYDYSENWADTYCIPSGTATHAFPTTTTDALGHRTKKSFFSCTVLPQSVKDENDIQAARNGITFTYEVLNRPLTVNFPDGGQTTYCYSHNSSLPCYTTSLPPFSTESRLITGSTTLNTKTLLDSYGRVAETQLTSDPQGTVYADTTYDALGHVSTVSNPYRSTSDSTYGITTYDYDALGRTTLVIPPDGTTTANNVATAYAGNCTTLTDQTAKARKSCSDALGRLTGVWEDPGASPHLNYETDYTYDVLDNLLTVVQNGSRQRTFSYDSLSRLLTASNPESGSASYSYDPNGNLVSKTSPAPNQTGSATITLSYCYDTVNRMVSKAYTSQSCPMSSPVATYAYDAPSVDGHTMTNPIGRLVKAATTDGKSATWNSYDQLGRIATQWQCSPLNCGATPYTKTFANDLLGNHTSETYSYTTGTVTISYTYDAASRPTQVTSSYVDSQHPATLATVDPTVGYWPNGAIRKITFANGLTEAAGYNNRLQPCRMNVNSTSTYFAQCTDAVPSGNVLDFAYGFNAGTSNNGSVASWSAVGQQSFNRTFTYDSLNRIATMADSNTGQACRGLSWTIDAWGNRTDQTVTAGTCNTFHQSVDSNNRLLGAPFQYDSAGNMNNDGSHAYTFDAENRVTQVDSGSTATYIYDADGRRVWKSSGGSTTDYLYDLSGNIFAEFVPGCGGTGCWAAGAIYLNGQFFAEYYNSTTYFVHPDHLGSSRLLTALDQSICDNLDYLPYGEELSGGSCTNLRFTGQEHDSESGLDNFIARHNSSSSGRFMSPDPGNAGAHLPSPQSWNAYSYVWNNPINAIDPDGLDCLVIDRGAIPSVIRANSFNDNCGGTPAPPPDPKPVKPTCSGDFGDCTPKPSTACTNAFESCTPGNVTGNPQPNLAAMRFQGPGGSVIGGYGGHSIFDAVACAGENDPSDPDCWGVKLSLKGGMFQWSWSLDAYATDKEKNFIVYEQRFQFGSKFPDRPIGTLLVNGDPLDSSKLIDFKPIAVALPTAHSYQCTGVARQLGPYSKFQTLCR